MRGFSSDADANAASARVALAIDEIVQELQLSIVGLDGVTIAYDYDDALARLDRGFDASSALTRTNSDVAQGCAMAAPVMRNGQAMSHLVLSAFVVPLIDTPMGGVSGKYIIAHELSHVHENYFRDLALPNILLKTKITKPDEAVLFETADSCWSEYAACHLSAAVNPDHAKFYEVTVLDLLGKARNEIIGAKRDWIVDRVFAKVWQRVGTTALSLLKYFSYLLGHAAGLGEPAEELAPNTFAVLQSNSWLLPWILKLNETLAAMFDTFGDWKTLDVFEPLKQVARDLLGACGITISDSNGKLFVYVDDGELPVSMSDVLRI
jgi:hypothetical protein